MRFTAVLLKQHIGKHFKKHWIIQGKRKPMKTAAEAVLTNRGIPIYDPEEIIREKRTFDKVEVIGWKSPPLVQDESHPDWHDDPLLTYEDNNVLLEGLRQAKILVKTVEIKEGLPEKLDLCDVSKDIHSSARNIILSSHLFDAQQVKLPKLKDPERPAWNFPRVYGITQNRRFTLLITKLLQLIESTADPNLVKDRYLFNDLLFSLPFERAEHLIQFQLTGDFFLTSSKPLAPFMEESTEDLDLPDISPIDPVISLEGKNIYRRENIYPLNSNLKKYHPHTLIINYDPERVRNIYEEQVTTEQVYGRSLLKAFTVAASYAKTQYGDDVKALPEPVSVQCVQTDGRFFHFGVFQLNTLELTNGGAKNVWYQTPLEDLFESCSYELGKPVLRNYNNRILSQLYAFYNNS